MREMRASDPVGNIPVKESKKKRWVWLALGAMLVLYVFCALRVDPMATFGSLTDDALYFTSAKSLANGGGYVLPSFPARLGATKYPELYPLLLAGVWKLDPNFPSNVRIAIALTLLFGCAALVFAFLILRGWPGLGDWWALVAVGLCAFTSLYLELSASVMTDIPFMAVTLAAIWLAQHPNGRISKAFGAGLLAGFSVGLRSLGVASIAGIGLVMLTRREYRRTAWFSAGALPLTLASLWPALAKLANHSGASLLAHPTQSGWQQTVCFYTSYACSWRMNIGSAGAFGKILLTNLKEVVQEPGLYLFYPLATRDALWSVALVTLISVASYAGIVRYWRKAGLEPFLAVFLFYLLVIVPWPWTPERFLVTFLPLLFGGLVLEGRRFASVVAEHLRPTHLRGERTIAAAIAAGGLVLAIVVAFNFAFAIPRTVGALASDNRKFLVDLRGAYGWVRQHSARDAKIIAVEDGLAYLYTGRPSVVPLACLTEGFYEDSPRFAEHDAAHLADVARHIGATYWLATVRDFALNDSTDSAILRQREEQLLASAPIVYRSADGVVKIYDVSSLFQTSGNVQGLAPGGERKNRSRP